MATAPSFPTEDDLSVRFWHKLKVSDFCVPSRNARPLICSERLIFKSHFYSLVTFYREVWRSYQFVPNVSVSSWTLFFSTQKASACGLLWHSHHSEDGLHFCSKRRIGKKKKWKSKNHKHLVVFELYFFFFIASEALLLVKPPLLTKNTSAVVVGDDTYLSIWNVFCWCVCVWVCFRSRLYRGSMSQCTCVLAEMQLPL